MSQSWDASEGRMNAAVFGRYAHTCTYLPLAGESFELRYILRAPAIDQPLSPGYFADLEVIPGDLPLPPRRGDEVSLDGVRYVVAKVAPRQPHVNLLIALHRKADK